MFDVVGSMHRLLHPRECDIRYCMSGGVITCLSLLKPYCVCEKHAVAQCFCIIITTRLKQAWVNVDSWSERDLSCYTTLLSLKKTARPPKRRLWLSLKKSHFAKVPTETLASLLCYSMPENSARNSKCHCNAIVVTTMLRACIKHQRDILTFAHAIIGDDVSSGNTYVR